jgi:uncharacterized protein involved in exopolysaccharide biosynthesis
MSTGSADITLAAIIRTVHRLRWLFLALVALGASLGIYLAVTIPPLYRATTVVSSVSDDALGGSLGNLRGRLGGLAALAGVAMPSVGGERVEAIALLSANEFTWDFIRERDLMPVLFPSEWNPKTRTWDLPREEIPTQADAVQKFARYRTVDLDPRTGLVSLSIDWTDPKLAAEWANDLVNRLNRQMRERTIREAQQSLKFLSDQSDQTQVVQVRQAIDGLIEEQMNRVMLASARPDFAVRVIDPATAPDFDDVTKPRRFLLIAAGFFLGGLMVCGVLTLIFGWRYLRHVLSNARDADSATPAVGG